MKVILISKLFIIKEHENRHAHIPTHTVMLKGLKYSLEQLNSVVKFYLQWKIHHPSTGWPESPQITSDSTWIVLTAANLLMLMNTLPNNKT